MQNLCTPGHTSFKQMAIFHLLFLPPPHRQQPVIKFMYGIMLCKAKWNTLQKIQEETAVKGILLLVVRDHPIWWHPYGPPATRVALRSILRTSDQYLSWPLIVCSHFWRPLMCHSCLIIAINWIASGTCYAVCISDLCKLPLWMILCCESFCVVIHLATRLWLDQIDENKWNAKSRCDTHIQTASRIISPPSRVRLCPKD